MTTYSFDGAAVRTDTNGAVLDAYAVTYDLVMQDGNSSAEFTFSGGTQFYQDVVLALPGLQQLRLNGTVNDSFLADTDSTIATINTSSGASYVLLDAYNFINDYEYFVNLGLNTMPVLTNISAASSFGTSITSTTNGTGRIQDGVPFALDQLHGVSVTENDLLLGTVNADTLVAGIGMDTLQGGDSNDSFELDAGDGGDSIDGGNGLDSAINRMTGVTAWSVTVEADLQAGTSGIQGTTTGQTILTSVEDYYMTAAAQFDARISGSSANNVLQSGAGADALDGRDGDDLLYAGDGADGLTGGTGNDTLHAGDGDDTLDGGAGGDNLDGGNGFDLVSYASATRSVRVDLANDAFMYNDAVGDTFMNVEAFAAGAYADQLRGDAGANEFYGRGLSDRLYGRAGDDLLFGETGADALYGGTGADTMTGGDDAGRRDRYIYFNMVESGVGTGNRDVITDFVAGEDRIEISRFDADLTQGFKQGFAFIADTAFSGAAGELRFEQTGGNTIVQADVTGDGLADFEIELSGLLTLTTTDFLI